MRVIRPASKVQNKKISTFCAILFYALKAPSLFYLPLFLFLFDFFSDAFLSEKYFLTSPKCSILSLRDKGKLGK